MRIFFEHRLMSIHETVTLEKEEHIIALYRRHGATVCVAILPYALLIILLFLFVFPLFSLGVNGVVLFAVLGCLFSILALRKILAWLGTITILTSKRLLVIQRFGFMKKKVNEIKLDQISELSYEVKGFIQTVGRCGTLFLLVTFTSATIGVPDIPDPQGALNAISQAITRVSRSIGQSVAAPQMPAQQTGVEKGSNRDSSVVFHSVPRRDPANWK